jgi:hypothetical protein
MKLSVCSGHEGKGGEKLQYDYKINKLNNFISVSKCVSKYVGTTKVKRCYIEM